MVVYFLRRANQLAFSSRNTSPYLASQLVVASDASFQGAPVSIRALVSDTGRFDDRITAVMIEEIGCKLKNPRNNGVAVQQRR